jgi:hypothetical protein
MAAEDRADEHGLCPAVALHGQRRLLVWLARAEILRDGNGVRSAPISDNLRPREGTAVCLRRHREVRR